MEYDINALRAAKASYVPSAPTLGVLAAGYNALILVFNCGFSNAPALAALDAEMFSAFGQLMVVVWAVAFYAAGVTDVGAPVWYAFALEKLVYVCGWARWHSQHDARALLSAAIGTGSVPDVLAPLFHTIYGTGDMLFCLAFLCHASSLARRGSQRKAR